MPDLEILNRFDPPDTGLPFLGLVQGTSTLTSLSFKSLAIRSRVVGEKGVCEIGPWGSMLGAKG